MATPVGSAPGAEGPIRISKIAGRYLVFSAQSVMRLRRHHNICSVFVGTTPLAPSQNACLTLPLELMPEEAAVLVSEKAAIVEDASATRVSAGLGSVDPASREKYIDSLKERAAQYQRLRADEKARSSAAALAKQKQKNKNKNNKQEGRKGGNASAGTAKYSGVPENTDSEEPGLFVPAALTSERSASSSNSPAQLAQLAITPTVNGPHLSPLLPPSSPLPSSVPVAVPPSYTLYKHLHQKGYFMTPGIRFGCQYSVYPGDPLRFHAHFLAKHYGWDEEIKVLDIVAFGRLATAVKKGYLIGGEEPNSALPEGEETTDWGEDKDGAVGDIEGDDVENERESPGEQVRTFSIEWAGF